MEETSRLVQLLNYLFLLALCFGWTSGNSESSVQTKRFVYISTSPKKPHEAKGKHKNKRGEKNNVPFWGFFFNYLLFFMRPRGVLTFHLHKLGIFLTSSVPNVLFLYNSSGKQT